jgi:hypothetical protein
VPEQGQDAAGNEDVTPLAMKITNWDREALTMSATVKRPLRVGPHARAQSKTLSFLQPAFFGTTTILADMHLHTT